MTRHTIVVVVLGYVALVTFTLLLLSANETPDQDTEVTDASSLADGENSLHTDKP